MIDVDRVDVCTCFEEEIGNSSRAGKVERCLAVAAALIDSGRILGEQPQKNVGSIEVRRRARVGNRAGC